MYRFMGLLRGRCVPMFKAKVEAILRRCEGVNGERRRGFEEGGEGGGEDEGEGEDEGGRRGEEGEYNCIVRGFMEGQWWVGEDMLMKLQRLVRLEAEGPDKIVSSPRTGRC